MGSDLSGAGAGGLTPRLEIRPPREADRARFVELFGDEDFMVFSAGVLTAGAANDRFDRMLARAAELTFAKQPVIERSTGVIIGYSGVDRFELDGQPRLEYGYRLVPEARSRGYATEAGRAVLARAAATYRGEVLAIIDPTNSRHRTSPASSASRSGSRRWSTASSTTSTAGAWTRWRLRHRSSDRTGLPPHHRPPHTVCVTRAVPPGLLAPARPASLMALNRIVSQ